MAKIDQLSKNGQAIYPVTHESAVLDSNGVSIDRKMNEANDKINGKAEQQYVDEELGKVNSQLETIQKKACVSVTDYGAKGDGVTDDSQAFLQAKSNAKKVYIPNGHYKLNSILDCTDISLVGESMNGVTLDFSNCNNDDYCIFYKGFRLEMSNFKIICNSNTNQFAIKCNYLSDSSILNNIVIDNDNPNGIFIEKSWYFTFDNIRVRNTKTTGVCLQINNNSEGGVNSLTFKNIFLAGGLHNIKFTGNTHNSEALKFIGCSFEHSDKTSIVNEVLTRNNNISFDTCYFEYVYKNTTDSDVPIICDSVGRDKLVFRNCLIRVNNINNRFLFKGNTSLNNINNVNYIKLFNESENPNITVGDNVRNVSYPGRSYQSKNSDGLQIIETISNKETGYLYKKKIITKDITSQNVDTPVFRLNKPNNTNTALNVKIIFTANNNYTRAYLEYAIFDIGKASTKTTLINNTLLQHYNKSDFLSVFTVKASNSAYDITNDIHYIDISFNANHSDLLGNYTVEVDGYIHENDYSTNRSIVTL